MNQFFTDLLNQPDTLQAALDRFDQRALQSLANQVQSGRFDRIVISGMGSSYFAAYPMWLHLTQRGLPVWLVEASELLHAAPNLVTPKTLFCLISQSGQSAEIVALLDRMQPAHVLAVTNTEESPLAQRAQSVMPIHAGVEGGVSTKTYLNTVALLQVVARQLSGDPLAPLLEDLQQFVPASRRYLADWQAHVDGFAQIVKQPQRIFYLGRGASLATVQTAALISKEGAKMHVEAMSAGQFRHGPLELADQRVTAVIVEGDLPTATLNRRLASELPTYGVQVAWVSATPSDDLPTIRHPAARGIALPLAEILPLQLMVLHLAKHSGVEAGQFRHSGKVTLAE